MRAQTMAIDHGRPSIVVFTDASWFHNRNGISGWAGFCNGDGFDSVYYSGAGPRCGSSHEAELWAIAKTLESMRNDRLFDAMDTHIILQSDSLDALRIVHGLGITTYAAAKKNDNDAEIGQPRGRPAWAKKPAAMIENILYPFSCVYLRHVRAHQGGHNVRSAVNEKCDRLAKAAATAQFEAAP